MKKIAYILTTYPCPSETFIYNQIKQLKKKGFEIDVFAAEGEMLECFPKQDLNIYYRPSIFSIDAIWSIICTILRYPLRLAKLMVLIAGLLATYPREAGTIFVNIPTICFFARAAKRQYSEHIHACFFNWPACIGLGLSILLGLPFSIEAHARDIFVEAGAINLKARKAKFITCCTRQGLEYLKSNINSAYHNRLFLNYHGIVPNDKFNKSNNDNNGFPSFIIAVGRLVEKKGFNILIEACMEVLSKHPDMSLIIVGDGPQKQFLKDKIKELGLTDKVHIMGWLDHSHTLKLISQAEILIVPSIIAPEGDRDGLPNVILEAFSIGTPVIASNLDGICEAVINEKTGLLVKPGNRSELADAIKKLLANKELTAHLANNAEKIQKENFDIEKNCLKLAEFFTKSCNTKDKRIKIAHIVEGFVGGISTYLCNVLVSLVEMDFDVSLIYSPDRCDIGTFEKIEKLKRNGIKVHLVPMVRSVNPVVDLYCLFVMTQLFIKERFDIIHTHCSKAGAIGRIAARFAGIKKVYHSSHCFAFLRCGNFFTKKMYLLTERLLAKLTTKFIAVSQSDAVTAKNWKIFDGDKCMIVNNGLPLQESCRIETCRIIAQDRIHFNIPPKSSVVITACRLVEYKGLFIFLEAIKRSNSNAVFVIAGDGPLKQQLREYIYNNNLIEKVRLPGHVCDMDRLYRICDMVVLCSKMEAQPYSILEAMRAKCAVIASDVDGNRELLTNDRGVLVKQEPLKIAKAINYLLNDSRKRHQLAQKAHNYFCNRHNLEDQVQKLTCIYLDKDYNYNRERIGKIANNCTETICSM